MHQIVLYSLMRNTFYSRKKLKSCHFLLLAYIVIYDSKEYFLFEQHNLITNE